MPLEIEYKFLVKNDNWRHISDAGKRYKQAYVSTGIGSTVRLRVVEDQGYLTLKGQRSGISRFEYGYSIPVKDAEEMMQNLCSTNPVIKIIGHKSAGVFEIPY